MNHVEDQKEVLPVKVNLTEMMAKIKDTTYTLLPNGRTTICQVTLENGFTVEGSSACVVKEEYNQALGEKYSFEKVIDKMWELEGYLLAEKRYQASKA
jgi:hypothetical protein